MNAFEKIQELICTNNSFVLEAGAGAGKTYTLIQTLNYIIEHFGIELLYKKQKIVCITYTNVAKNEIIERINDNSLITVSTIHEFLWGSIKTYQNQLKEQLIVLNDIFCEEEQKKYESKTGKEKETFKFRFIPSLSERIHKVEKIQYDDSNYRDFEQGQLKHDDIITLSKLMFQNYPLLTSILLDKHPYVLVDEYQDTASETIELLINSVLDSNEKRILLGFFGDSHQKIYEGGVGSLEPYINNGVLVEVKKEENYRSSEKIVELLNHVRKNIQQISQIQRPNSNAKFLYYLNPPKLQVEKKGKLKEEGIREYETRIQPFKDEIYSHVIDKLKKANWDIDDDGIDKILVLTNSKVAGRSGFGDLYKVFSRRYSDNAKQRLLDREDSIIQFLIGALDKKTSIEREIGIEHLCRFWENKEYHKVIKFVKKQGDPQLVTLNKHEDKVYIYSLLNELVRMRDDNTIYEVISYVSNRGLSIYSERIKKVLALLDLDIDTIEDEEEKAKIKKNKNFLDAFLNIPYIQVKNLFEHTQNNTVFSTKHGTKGEEYRNVLVILDDTEWKQEYSFNKFFSEIDDNPKRFEMTKNLFYVSCSRAIENLLVLMFSPLEETSLKVVQDWFGKDNVQKVEDFLSCN